jgi:histone deacetylase complex regulatory component SIN3
MNNTTLPDVRGQQESTTRCVESITINNPKLLPQRLVKKVCSCFLIISIGLWLIGCGTPMAVKRLSLEQTQVTTAYQQTLKSYFEVIEKFADSQEKAADALIDLTLSQIQSDLKKNATEDAAKAGDEASRKKVMNQLASGIAENVSGAQEKKALIHELVGKLKQKNTELLNAHAAIVAAQEKLNTYIQMKKADEAVFDELVGIVGINKEKLTQAVGEITNIAGEIQNVSAALKETKP